MSWTTRLVNAFRRTHVDADIDEELQFHLQERVRDNVHAGMAPDAARREAERRFGGLLHARERTRAADAVVWIETAAQDVRYALRSFRHSPITTLVIVGSLALSIGATTALFSVVNAALLRPLPYADAGRLAILWTAHLLNGSMEQNTSLPNMEDWKANARSFEDMAAWRESRGSLLDPDTQSAGGGEWVRWSAVTDNFFALLGRPAAVGRVFTRDDFTPGRSVAVVTHGLWQRHFAAAADVIGKRVSVGGLEVEIVGVMPADFWFPRTDVQLWVPASLDPFWQKHHGDRGTRFGAVAGRLAANATLGQARAEMRLIAARLRQAHSAANRDLDINVVPLETQLLGTRVPFMLLLLFGAVLCVLLIASANIASLLLARGVARRREMAMRTALGASQSRVARQLLTESVLLAISGGCAGLIAVAANMRALLAFAPGDVPRIDEVRVDTTVLLFTFILSVTTGLLFGLAPVVALRGDGSAGLMRATARNVIGAARGMRRALVVFEFAVALVLLTAAGLLLRSLAAIRAVDSGFADRSVVTAQLRFDPLLPPLRRSALYQEAMDRIGRLPGVRAAGAVGRLFWTSGISRFGLRAVDGHSDKPRDQWEELTWTSVSGNYFQALAVPLLRGRFFQSTDTKEAPPVVIINETMARRYWPGQDPIGRRIKGFDPRGSNDDWVTVVGVVKDVHSYGLERAPVAQIFESRSQAPGDTENLVVAAALPQVIEPLRRAIRELDRTALLTDVSTLDDRLSNLGAQRRFETYLLAAFAALALLLAASGVFGTMHYSVVQRTQEIGIRMALGADARTVLLMVFHESLAVAASGVALGIAGSLAAMRLISSSLFGVAPYDPGTYIVTSLGLTLVAVIASGVPAMRAARVDPMLALRTE